jgi:hypothetical protein
MKPRGLPFLVALIVTMVLTPSAVAVAAPSAPPKPGWIHWEGQYYTCWIPNKKWQVVESTAGITISSPTGDQYVEFGWSSWMQPLTTQEVVDFTFEQGMLHPLVNHRVVASIGPESIPQGQRQAVEWAGVWQHQLKGRQSARGYVIADVMDYGGTYGFSAYVEASAGSAATWKRNVGTLDIIRQNIVLMGNG